MPSLAQFRAVAGTARAAQAVEPTSVGDRIKGLALGAAQVPLEGLATVGDYLSRPQIGLSEAYGAHESGEESLYGAFKRGFTGGIDRAQYPTFGERIVPEEEGEDLGRKIARFGAEMVTDPSILVGGPVVKGVTRGGITAARALKGTKAAKAFAGSDAAQSLSRLVLPMSENLKRFGGGGGETVAHRARLAMDEADEVLDRELFEFARRVKAAGLSGGRNAERRKRVSDVIQSGELSGDAQVDELALYLKSRFDDIGTEVSKFTDDYGEIFRVRGKPFEMLPNYYPQMLNHKELQRAMSNSGMQEVAASLAKRMKITEAEALDFMKSHTGRVKRAGHIENPRLRNVPEDMLELDPAIVFPRYVREVSNRMSVARQFGVDQRLLTESLESATKAGMSSKTAEEARRAILGIHTPSAFGLDNLAPKLMGFQVLTKMGPTSALANISQQSNIIVAEGMQNYVRGLSRLASDSGLRQRSLDAFRVGLRAQLDQLVGASEAGVPGFATKWLQASGFTGAEKMNRMAAYAGGVASAEQMGLRAINRGALSLPDELAKLGIKPADWNAFRSTGKFAPDVERHIGIQAANNTQFTTRFLDLPPIWRTPEMRLAMQFRSFIYQQTRFLGREVIGPALKYVDSGGRQGNVAPLMRALAIYPVAGHTVANLRELYAQTTANRLGVKRKFERKIDRDHPVMQMAMDSLYVGSMGMAGDMLEQASRGRILDWAAGPTASGLAYGAETGVSSLQKMLFEGEYPGVEDAINQGIRLTPGRRAVPLSPSELQEISPRRVLRRNDPRRLFE